MNIGKAQYDIVVVGAGHNTLTAAAYLARAGLSVLVLEQNPHPGGGAVSSECTVPGFIHDNHATAASHLQTHPIVTHDELQLLSRFGLKFVYSEISAFTLFPDGDTLANHNDIDKTCDEIARYSQRDAESYRRLVKFMASVMPMIGMTMSRPPVSLAAILRLLEETPFGNQLILSMMKSAYDIVVENFEHPKVRMHFLKWAADTSCGPEEKTTGLNMLFLLAGTVGHPMGTVVGGTRNLSLSMIHCIEAHGGTVRCNARVARILNADGRASAVRLDDGEVIAAGRAVVAAIHPHHLGDIVEGLDPGLVDRARRTVPGAFGTLMVHAAMNGPANWLAGQGPTQCISNSIIGTTDFTRFRRSFDDLKYGVLPETFVGGVCVQTDRDPTRAPAGKHTLYCYVFSPYEIEGRGAAGWDAMKEQRADWILRHLETFAPGFGAANILGRHVESPLDMVRHSPSFQGGDIMGLGSYLYQSLGLRPTAELSQYRVPGAQGLYLSGPFMHPGGGLTGGGRAVAIRVMDDLGVPHDAFIRT